MSKVAELMYDIQELYIDGMSARTISVMLDCPLKMVLAALEDMNVEDEEDSTPQDEDLRSSYQDA